MVVVGKRYEEKPTATIYIFDWLITPTQYLCKYNKE